MRTNRNFLTTIKVLTIIAALVFQAQCGKKETIKNGIKANILFSIGSVEVQREGINVTNLNPGDIIKEGDIIMTGDKSQVTIQVGDRGCVRIVQNTEVKISKLFLNNATDIFLHNGEIISNISRLRKDENYTITTKTIKAAIRGTAFSVSIFKDEEHVAVLKGKVAVTINENISKGPIKETNVKDGEMAAVQTADTKTNLKEVKIQIMPIDKTMSIVIEKVAMIEIVPDIENVKIEELNKRQQEMIKKEEELDRNSGTEKLETGTTSKIKAAGIEKLIKQKTRTLDEIKKVTGRIDEITLNSGEIIKGAIISRGKIYSVLTTNGVINVSKEDIRTLSVIK
ncbi:MAG TPA: FecR family protein [Spirochaetota bacterium]|nr:FecR family protein [Spirochaetota bacterium]HPS87188.1 FecR family protein [Spirochaetota bacterium]